MGFGGLDRNDQQREVCSSDVEDFLIDFGIISTFPCLSFGETRVGKDLDGSVMSLQYARP